MEVLAIAIFSIVPVFFLGRLFRAAARESNAIHRPKFDPVAETVDDHGVSITLSDDSGAGLL